MAKINTLNYQPLSVWDGDDDLFIVQQVDDTKVATPDQLKQYVLGEVDEVPTEDSDNLVKSGGIFSTMAVPKYDATNRREYFEGGAAFDGNIDSVPTAGSNNAVASGGTKTYVDNAVAKTSITPTLNSGFAMDNGSITISNKVCYFAPNFYKNSDFTVGTAVDIGTLPSNCKPKTGIRIASLSGTAELLGVILIDTGGGIKYYPAHISRYFGYVQACFEVK